MGITINGVGVKGGVTTTFKEVSGKTTATTITKAVTMGYHLQDDDAGDYYSADIKTDPAYGTPVFDLIAGVSSCPPNRVHKAGMCRYFAGGLFLNLITLI